MTVRELVALSLGLVIGWILRPWFVPRPQRLADKIARARARELEKHLRAPPLKKAPRTLRVVKRRNHESQ